MKILRSFELTNSEATHAPWGSIAKPARGLVSEKGIEFQINRNDFRDPQLFDRAFKSKETICFAIKSTIQSRFGFESNARWLFKDREAVAILRAAWIEARDARPDLSKAATRSQANAEQCESFFALDFLVDAPAPEEKPAIIRLPPTTMTRKCAYLKAANGKPLSDWIFEQCDKALEQS